MSDLSELSKNELISRILSINRENSKLKTVLIRHQLLCDYYQKLCDNYFQINKSQINNKNENNLQINEIKYRKQIEILKSDKILTINLEILKNNDTIDDKYKLFCDKSTQYEIMDNSSENDINSRFAQNNSQIIINNNNSYVNECIYNEKSFNNNSSDAMTDKSIKMVTNEEDIKVNCNQSSDKLNNDLNGLKVSTFLYETNEPKLMINSNNMNNNYNNYNNNEKHKTFICKYCGKCYKQKNNLNIHLLRLHPDLIIQYKCVVNGCDFKTLIKSKFDKHCIKHKPIMNGLNKSQTECNDNKSNNNVIVCQWPNCKLTFSNRTKFLRHQMTHRESSRVCPNCGQQFNGFTQLKEHMKSHSNTLNMNRSEEIGVENGSVVHTMREIDSKYKCNWISCNYSTNNRSDFVKHHSKHISMKSLCCDFQNCEYKTSNDSNLKVHQKKAHGMFVQNF